MIHSGELPRQFYNPKKTKKEKQFNSFQPTLFAVKLETSTFNFQSQSRVLFSSRKKTYYKKERRRRRSCSLNLCFDIVDWSKAAYDMAGTIITSETPSSSSQLNSSSRIICRVCQKQFSQYTCPRCNTRYCSLQCYKSHSLHCTESFMRENVLEELRQLQPQDETKKKMLDILKRCHAEEDMEIMEKEDSDSKPFLSEEAIQKVLSGGQLNLDDLSLEEQKEFQRLIASGELSKLIEPWEPWWLRPSAKHLSLSQDGTQLVQPLDSKDGEVESSQIELEDGQGHEIPSGPEAPLPSVRKLREGEPSPLLAVHLVDILYSYCFTLRLYNGDWKSDSLGASVALSSVSSVLGKGGLPESVLEALSYCLEQTCSPAFKHVGGTPFGLLLMDDVVNILSLGGAAIICLLCDLQRMIEAAEKELKTESTVKSQRKDLMTKLKSAKKKLYFFMCWANEQPKEAWSSLALIVKAEKSSAEEYANSEKGHLRIEKKTKAEGKPLIREVE